MKTICIVLGLLGFVLTLGGCGGSGEVASAVPGGTELVPGAQPHGGNARTHTSYAEYTPPGTYIATWDSTEFYPDREGVRRTYVGGDVGPKDALRHVVTQGGIEFYLGQSRDGVGVHRLEKYAYDMVNNRNAQSGDGLYPFRVRMNAQTDALSGADLWLHPNLRDAPAELLDVLFDAKNLINDALPPEAQMRLFGWSDDRGTGRADDDAGDGELLVMAFDPDRNPCGTNAIACATNAIALHPANTQSSRVYIPTDLLTGGELYARGVIVHELLHALGLWGHVDSIEFPDSALGTAGSHIPHLGFGLPRIDREVLQIIYMGQLTDLYNDWGEWSDTAHHVMARAGDGELEFGVSLFNGLPQPWAEGVTPRTAPADNPRLHGAVTWEGALVGFSGPSPLGGAAELEVNLDRLEGAHALRLSGIHYLNRFEVAGADAAFTTPNMAYEVWLDPQEGNGNWFANWDPVNNAWQGEGFVNGSFLGAAHEHMGGTIKRVDMVGAFGGSRD